MYSHDVDYKIIGDDIQLVEIELDPSESVIAEAGTMMYMEQEIDFQTKMGDGSNPNEGLFDKLFKGAGRLISGESLFLTHFTNRGFSKSHVAFAAPYPGTIVPIELSQFNGQITVQRDAFLCAAMGTKVSIVFNRKLGAGFFSGEGFILQRIEGDGRAFIHAGGTVVEKVLNGETLRVDTGCVVGFTSGIDFDIQQAGGLKSMVFGGEGMFLATLRGHGKVWLQSMPISKLVRELSSMGGNQRKETGGFLNQFLQD
ncbi:MAG TPA: TIGR00266 family protein [Prolixibacteraceae bacterium]|nr:TIGR00266 family protein [Bacteroidales bacterium]HQN93957.1 TIGR00266 family protein [Prolixibacteraceae bacterium]HUM89115.1 TIGR00266 family protein [Prolixibacteraceae bacterium]